MNRSIRYCLFLVTYLLFCVTGVFSQSSLNYTVTTGTTASLSLDKNNNTVDLATGSTLLLSTNTTFSNSILQPMGFQFIFMGKSYTHFIAGNDGQLALGLSTSPTSILFTTGPNVLTRTSEYPPALNSAPVLAAFWDDLKTASNFPTLRSKLIGTAPNRCLVIEWNVKINTNSTTSASPADGQFQIRLYEATNEIEYVYGKMAVGPGSDVVTASIGFTAGANDNQFLALQNLSTFTFTSLAANEPATRNLVNTSVTGNISGLNSSSDINRVFFSFLPPQLLGNFAGTLTSNVGSSSMQLNWTDNFSNETSFTIYRSSNNVNFTRIADIPANSTNYIATQLSNNTRYYWKVYAFTEGDIDSTASFSDSTHCTMGGTYSIGSGGNFSSITQAVDSLRLKGMIAPVILEVQNNYTSAGETFPIVFPKNITCRQPGYDITVRPVAGTVNIDLINTTSSSMFILDSINNVFIDGRPGGTGTTKAFTFKSNGPAFTFRNARNNSITYSTIRSASAAAGTAAIILEGTQGNGSDNNTIDQCDITDNISLPRVLIRSYTSGGVENSNNSLTNSNLFNFSAFALLLTQGNKGWTIKNNSFYFTQPVMTDSIYGGMILLEDPGYDTVFVNTITDNYFGGSQPQCGGVSTQITFKENYQVLKMPGKTVLTGNHFKKLYFRHFEPGSSYYANLKIAEANGLIRNNRFGGVNEDSIAVLNESSREIKMDILIPSFTGSIQQTVDSNTFSNVRLRTTTNASVSLTCIRGSVYMLQLMENQIGGDGSAGIWNYTPGIFSGMIISSTWKHHIRNNLITRVTSYGQLQGMEISSGGNNDGRLRVVDHNTISYLAGHGISLKGIVVNGYAGRIVNNKIHGLTIIPGTFIDGQGLSGIFVNTSARTDTITGNLIHSLQTPDVPSPHGRGIVGIYMGIGGSNVNIHNNMIRLGLDSLGNSITADVNIMGISGGPLNGADISHNTVYITGSGVPAANGISSCIGFGGVIYLHNNLLINKRSSVGTGEPVNTIIYTSQNVDNFNDVLDYNIYYTQGSLSCFASAYVSYPTYPIYYSTLSHWQTASGNDLHSIQDIPNLVNPDGTGSSVNLHVQSPTSTEGKGRAAFTIQTDYDDENRNGLTPVDFGADAGNFTFKDAWPPELFPDSIPNHHIDSVQKITVRIKDDSGTDTAGNFKPRMWFRKIDPTVSPWFSVRGELVQGNLNDGTWKFTIDYSAVGLTVFVTDSVECYFVARDTTPLHSIGYAPLRNGNHTDVSFQNNSPTTTYKYQLTGQLPDTISVGAGQFYTSLTNNGGAFRAINKAQFGPGGVTVIITSDLSELGIYGLNNCNWPNSDSIRIITNTPVAKTINSSGNLSDHMIRVLNSSKILIDGSVNNAGNFLLFRNTNAQVENTTRVIDFGDYCKKITVRNCTFESNGSYAIAGGLTQPEIVIGADSSVVVYNNIFRAASSTTSMTVGVYGSRKTPGLIISENKFINYERSGIELTIAADSCIITGNHFYFTSPNRSYRTQVAIMVNGFVGAGQTPGGGHIVANNYIGGTAPFCGGSTWIHTGVHNSFPQFNAFAGIVVVSSNTLKSYIYNNTIKNIQLQSPNNTTFTGISGTNLVDIGGLGGNIIGDPSIPNSISNASTSSTVAIPTSGIVIGQIADGIVVANNIISNLTATGATHTPVKGIAGQFIQTGVPGTTVIENNIIQNLETSGNQAQASPGYAAAGIAIDPSFSADNYKFVIRRNLIRSLKCSNSSNNTLAAGIYMDANNCIVTIQRNKITTIENKAASGGKIAGLYLVKGYHRIENNQVSLTNGTNTNAVLITGIDDRTNNSNNNQIYSRFYYNSIHIGGTASSGTVNSYSANFLGALKIDKFKNNILYNNRTGGTGKHLALGINIPSNISQLWTSTTSDHNFLVNPDTTILVERTGSGFLSLYSFKLITSGDASSYARPVSTAPVDSLFINSSAGDLNINYNRSQCWYVNGKGLPVDSISADYEDSTVRSTSIVNGTTDIGSDEFNTTTIATERICPGSDILFTTDLTGVSYQWQVNSGTGFINITDDPNYTGTNTSSLHLANIPSSWYNYQYRCVVDGNNGIIYAIKFSNTWTGAVNSNWENPGNWSCGIAPDSNTDVVIYSGTVTINSNITVWSLTLSPGVTLIVNPGNTLTILH